MMNDKWDPPLASLLQLPFFELDQCLLHMPRCSLAVLDFLSIKTEMLLPVYNLGH